MTRKGQWAPEYRTWSQMINRCENPKATSYNSYGGRGITVCDRWRSSFTDFYADMGAQPSPEHSIERRDVNGNYTPDNCCWATPVEQGRNKRNNHLLTLGDETMPLSAWAERIGIGAGTIRMRIVSGWSVEQALLTPWPSWPREEWSPQPAGAAEPTRLPHRHRCREPHDRSPSTAHRVVAVLRRVRAGLDAGASVIRQCKACPWKVTTDPARDIPGGYNEARHRALKNTIAEPGLMVFTGSLHLMACHESAVGAEKACVGWLANQLGPGNNIGLRVAGMIGDLEDFELDGDQHERFEDTLPKVRRRKRVSR